MPDMPTLGEPPKTFNPLPGDNDVALPYTPLHMLVDNIGVYVGVGLLVASIVAAYSSWGRDRRRAQASLRSADASPAQS